VDVWYTLNDIRSEPIHLLEVSHAVRKYGKDEKNIQKFWSENLKGGDHSEELAVGGRIISEWI
jgi:hypothetical protein